MGQKLKNKKKSASGKARELHPIDETPTKKDPKGDGWSVVITLISGKTKRKGYYDPKGSIAGGKYFYLKGTGKNVKIEDCATLKEFPTHWHY